MKPGDRDFICQWVKTGNGGPGGRFYLNFTVPSGFRLVEGNLSTFVNLGGGKFFTEGITVEALDEGQWDIGTLLVYDERIWDPDSVRHQVQREWNGTALPRAVT